MEIDQHHDDCARLHMRLRMTHDDTARVDLILANLDGLLENSPECAAEIIATGLRLAGNVRDRDHRMAKLLYYEGIHAWIAGRGDAARASLEGAYEIFSGAPDDSEGRLEAARCAFVMGTVCRNTEQIREAIEWFARGLDGAGDDHQLRGDCQESLGLIHHAVSDYRHALEYLYQARDMRERSGDPVALAGTLQSVAKVLAATGDHAGALEQLQRGLEIARDAGHQFREVQILSDIGDLYRALGELPKALEFELKALVIYEMLDRRVELSDTLASIGRILEQQGEHEKGMIYQRRALEALESTREYARRASIILSIGRLYEHSMHYDDARFVLEQGLLIAHDVGERNIQAQIHLALSRAYEGLGDLAGALKHHRAWSQIREQLAGEEKQKEIASLSVRYHVQKMEHEREYFRSLAELREEEARNKQNELAAKALHLLQMVRLVESLKKQLKDVRSIAAGDVRKAVDFMLKELSELAGAELMWEAFEEQLHQVHPDFIRRLVEQCPMLAKMERRVCALIRIGLANKEIAAALNMSIRTVEAHRFNIRKKLRETMPPGTRLEAFLATI